MKLGNDIALGEGRKLAPVAAVAIAVAWAAFCPASAENLYFCPNADGKGVENWKSSTENHGWWIGKGNWTNALGVVKTPTASDMIWFNQTITNTLNGRGLANNVSNASGSGTVAGLIYTNNQNNTINQGTVTVVAGGVGVVICKNTTWYAGLAMSGTGEVPLYMPSGATLTMQKGLTGSSGVAVKRGGGTWVIANETARTFSAGGIRIEGGPITFGNNKLNETSGFTLTFAGNDATEVITLNHSNMAVKDLTLAETADVDNTDHGFTSSAGYNLAFLGGTSTMSPMSFTGSFKGNAGLVWAPANADTEIVLKKAAHPTTGGIWVSNGVVRVSEKVSFPSLAKVVVDGSGATFAVDASAGRTFPATIFEISNGGKLRVEAGAHVTVAAVTVGGIAVADGVYHGPQGPAVAWVDGPGAVAVGAYGGAAGSTATWDGAGVDPAATTLANWNGAADLPDLTNGTVSVSVTGGTAFTADVDAFLRGFTLGVKPFALVPEAGKALWLGAGGIYGSGGAVTVGGAGTVVAAERQMWTNGTFAVAGNIAAVGASVVRIYHAGSSKSPTFADGVTVDADVVLVDSSKASRGASMITIPANANITFNGKVVATNTSAISISSGSGSTVTFNDLFMSRDGGTISGSGRIVFNGPMHFRDRPGLAGGTVELHSTGNRLNGNMGTWNGGTLKAMVPYAINKTNTRRQTAYFDNNSEDGAVNTHINLKETCTIDLCGNDQSIDQLAMHADGTKSGGHVTSATPATFHLQTSKGYWPAHNYSYGFADYKTISSADGYGYETADKGYWEGAVNLSYEAADGMVRSMMRQSMSTGCVEVASGRLVFLRRATTAGETFDLKGGDANPYPRLANEDGAWPNATAVRVKGGTLALEHSAAFGDQVAVELSGNGQVELAHGVCQECGTLTLDGEPQRGGTYGGPESAASRKPQRGDGMYWFSGSGRLRVGGVSDGTAVIVR